MNDSPGSDGRLDADQLQRRQRGRNLALLIVLIGVAALFYAISVVRFKVS